jgi:hypothetical protein
METHALESNARFWPHGGVYLQVRVGRLLTQLDGRDIPARVEVFAGEISTAVETSTLAQSPESAALGARGPGADPS